MQPVVIIVLTLHILASVFWAGTTFAVARTNGIGGAELAQPQVGAGVIAFVTGGYLWKTLHAGRFGTGEQVLAIGIACAACALALQSINWWRAPKSSPSRGKAQGNGAQKVATFLLVIAVICMGSSKYL